MPDGVEAPWMVLEWLEGTTLAEELDARRGSGGRSPAEALALLRPVFDAVAHAHDEGIAHRDLKPANLMRVTSKRGEVTTRVLDFGIAKAMGTDEAAASGHTATATDQRAFSPHYAAPEQFAGTRTGPWTDVHALALMVTEALVDQPPYAGDDMQELLVAAVSPQRPTPAKWGADVGPWEPVLARALALKPTERFGHAREFLAALEAAVPSQRGSVAPTVLAAPPVAVALAPDTLNHASVARAVPPPRDRRLVTLVGVVALALVGAAVAVTTYRLASPAEHAARPAPTASRAPEQASAPDAAAPPVATPPSPVGVAIAVPERPLAPVAARPSPMRAVAPQPRAPTVQPRTRVQRSLARERLPVE
jgi:hypothetical protein